MKTIRVLISVLALGLFACGSGDDDDGDNADAAVSGPDAAGSIDAPPGTPDAANPDAEDTPDAGGAAGHTENNDGHWHMPGKEDPLTNCVSCHGAELQGDVGPSCYDCHNNDDHTINRGGRMHRSGSVTTCSTCHGPSNSGGLGPACAECH